MQAKLMVAAMLCCVGLHVSSAQKGYRQGGNSTATLKGKDANQTRDTDPSPSSDRRLSVIAAALDGRLRLQSGDCSHLVHAIYERAGFPYRYASSSDLYAGVQLVLPGEVAPAHRHTQSALRFVLEGAGAYTAVNGERTIMNEGDFIITPPWAWHDHGNQSDKPIFWLDGLDIPVVQFLDASFAEHLDRDEQPIFRPVGDSDARYGANLLPIDHKPGGGSSPVFNYPYARTREALERLRRANAWDPCHGLKMRYTNPITGNHAMATMGTFVQLLPKGFTTTAYRSTDATVFAPIEGRGRTHIGDFIVDWEKRDLFVVPSWQKVRHEAAEDSVLFSFSDRPIQEALHLFREDRGNV